MFDLPFIIAFDILSVSIIYQSKRNQSDFFALRPGSIGSLSRVNHTLPFSFIVLYRFKHRNYYSKSPFDVLLSLQFKWELCIEKITKTTLMYLSPGEIIFSC